MHRILAIVTCVLFLSACNVKPSYDVRVLNDSSVHLLFVSYSSSANATGPVSKEIVLKEGEHRVIITTGDLEKKLENLCQVVADHVVAHRQKD